MLSFQEAYRKICDAVQPLECEIIPTKEALGRVLAEDLFVPRDFPDTRLSAIDGYAFCVGDSDIYTGKGDVGAGSLPDFTLLPGECAAVMTGAPVPEGTDCMVRIEDCIEDNGTVRSSTPLVPGALINEAGSEAQKGVLLAEAGTSVTAAVYPALFYAGISKVKVYKVPRIGILRTGDELCDLDDELTRGMVYDTNGAILEAFLAGIHIKIFKDLRVSDDEKKIQSALMEMSQCCDFVISSGGVSMGRYDYIKKTFLEQDFNVLIQGTSIKPGRPLMLARKEGALFFGMPGYPSAFLTNCLAYLIPAVKKAGGRRDFQHQFIKATLNTPMRSRKGKLYCNRARLQVSENGWVVSDVGAQKTSHFLNFAQVNALAFLPENVDVLSPGDVVDCLSFPLELC